MRHFFAASLIGLGGVALAFGFTVFVLTFAVHQVDPAQGLHERMSTGIGSFVIGIVLVGAGVLLGGYARRRQRAT